MAKNKSVREREEEGKKKIETRESLAGFFKLRLHAYGLPKEMKVNPISY